MACPPYTAGDLKELQVIDETIFGTTPTTALKYAGSLQTISGGDTNMNAVKQRYGGSRTFDEMTYEASSFGFSGTFNFKNTVKAKDWSTVWGKYALGNLTSGPMRALPTFSALIVGGPSTYNLASGCMVNSLKLSSDGLGTPVMFDADVKCRAIQSSTSRTFTGVQSVIVGASTASGDEAIVHMNDYPTINTVKTPIKSWNLTINNQLFGVADKIGSEILANGLCLASEGVEISFVATRIASDEAWNEIKYAKTNNITVSIPVGTSTITLTGGAILGNDYPTRTQGQYDETLTVEFKGIKIS